MHRAVGMNQKGRRTKIAKAPELPRAASRARSWTAEEPGRREPVRCSGILRSTSLRCRRVVQRGRGHTRADRWYCYQHLPGTPGKQKPYLIITNGPTGSGKSGLAKKVVEHCGLGGRATTAYIRIDDLVESSTWYKAAVNKIVGDECGHGTVQLCDKLAKKIDVLDDTVVTRFNGAYAEARSGDNHCDNNTKTCDAFNDERLMQAIAEGRNIVFETTGTYYVKWLFPLLRGGYRVFYAFALVEFCENIARNKTRAIEQMEAYLPGMATRPAPRVPDVRTKPFGVSVANILSNLKDVMRRHADGEMDPSIERVLVFDNTGPDTSISYDSRIFTAILENMECTNRNGSA